MGIFDKVFGIFSKPRGGERVSRGKVKWFNEKKGFGFIIEEGGGPDIFVHYTAIASDGFKTLTEGEEVEFTLSQGPKGPQATNVVRLKRQEARQGA